MSSGAGHKNDALLQIAAVLKSNGTKGEILIGLKGLSAAEINTKEPVFVYHDGLPVPYFIESLTPRGTGKALVTFTGVRSLDESEELCGRAVMAREKDYPFLAEEENLIDIIMGWTVQDEHGAVAGPVTGVEDIPGNPCIEITSASGPALVPLSEDLILSVDETKRILRMRIPDGLL